jgi:hypothetical protein
MKSLSALAVFGLTALAPAARAARAPSLTAAAIADSRVYLGRLERLDESGQRSALFVASAPFQKWDKVEVPAEAREQEILFVRATPKALLLLSQPTLESGGAVSVYLRAKGQTSWQKKAEWKCTVLKSLRFAKGALTARCIHDDLAEGTSEERSLKPLKIAGFADGDFALPTTQVKEGGLQLELRKPAESNAAFAEIRGGGAGAAPIQVSAEKLPAN